MDHNEAIITAIYVDQFLSILKNCSSLSNLSPDVVDWKATFVIIRVWIANREPKSQRCFMILILLFCRYAVNCIRDNFAIGFSRHHPAAAVSCFSSFTNFRVDFQCIPCPGISSFPCPMDPYRPIRTLAPSCICFTLCYLLSTGQRIDSLL